MSHLPASSCMYIWYDGLAGWVRLHTCVKRVLMGDMLPRLASRCTLPRTLIDVSCRDLVLQYNIRFYGYGIENVMLRKYNRECKQRSNRKDWALKKAPVAVHSKWRALPSQRKEVKCISKIPSFRKICLMRLHWEVFSAIFKIKLQF